MNIYIFLFNLSYIRILFGYELYINYLLYFLFFGSLITKTRSLNKPLVHLLLVSCSLVPLQLLSNGSFLQSGLLSLSLISCVWLVSYLNKRGLNFFYYIKQTKIFLVLISPIIAFQLALDPNQLYLLGPPSATVGAIVVVMLFGNAASIFNRIFLVLFTIYAKTRAVSVSIFIAFNSMLWFKFLISGVIGFGIIFNLVYFLYFEENQRYDILLIVNKMLTGRLSIWEAHLTYFLNECFHLYGCGPTNADQAVVLLKDSLFVDNIRIKVVNSHNTYLGLIIDFGFSGACILILIVKNCLKRIAASGKQYISIIIVIGFILFFVKAGSTLLFAMLVLLSYTNSRSSQNHGY